MFSVIYWTLSNTRSSALCDFLRRYGVSDIHWQEEARTPEIPLKGEEVVLINGDHDFSCTAIRQLTFRTARLPKAFAIWEGPLKQEIFAVKVTSRAFVDRLAIHQDFMATVHSLAEDKGLVSATYDEFCSNSASAVGGSFSDSGVHQYFSKVAHGPGQQKLLDEIRMYRSLPDHMQEYYPRLLFASGEDGSVTMGTQFQDFPNLRDLLLNNRISSADVAEVLTRVLNFEYNQAFQEHKQPTPEGYIHDYHFHRAWRRLTMSAEIDPIFDPLISSKWMEINGQRIASVPAMLRRLEQDENIVRRLDPGGVSPFIHADFHPGNILCDISQDRFWLVDPRGYPVCDIYYDLGKLAQSTRSCYDLLHEGRHEVSHGIHGDTAVINYHFVSPHLRKQYADLDARLQPVIKEMLKSEPNSKDVDLWIRFNEAMHLCSLMPFHIHKNAQPSIAIPIFAAGATRLAEVMELLGIGMDECAECHASGLDRLAEKGHATWRFDG